MFKLGLILILPFIVVSDDFSWHKPLWCANFKNRKQVEHCLEEHRYLVREYVYYVEDQMKLGSPNNKYTLDRAITDSKGKIIIYLLFKDVVTLKKMTELSSLDEYNKKFVKFEVAIFPGPTFVSPFITPDQFEEVIVGIGSQVQIYIAYTSAGEVPEPDCYDILELQNFPKGEHNLGLILDLVYTSHSTVIFAKALSPFIKHILFKTNIRDNITFLLAKIDFYTLHLIVDDMEHAHKDIHMIVPSRIYRDFIFVRTKDLENCTSIHLPNLLMIIMIIMYTMYYIL